MSHSDSGELSKAIERKYDRVDELVSLLLDEEITAEEAQELEMLLVSDASYRGRYLEDVQLHCDLIEYFRNYQALEENKPISPILGFLASDENSASKRRFHHPFEWHAKAPFCPRRGRRGMF